MFNRVLRWWRLHWRQPKPFRCVFCGDVTTVFRRVLPYNAVIDHWNCPTCMAGGYGHGGNWYCG